MMMAFDDRQPRSTMDSVKFRYRSASVWNSIASDKLSVLQCTVVRLSSLTD